MYVFFSSIEALPIHMADPTHNDDHPVHTPKTEQLRTVKEQNDIYRLGSVDDIKVIPELESKETFDTDGFEDSTYLFESSYYTVAKTNNIYPKPIEERGKTEPSELVTAPISENRLPAMVVCHPIRVVKMGNNNELLVQLSEYERFKLHRTT